MGFRRARPELTLHTSRGRSRMMHRSDGMTLTASVYGTTGAWTLVRVGISTSYVYTERGSNQKALPECHGGCACAPQPWPFMTVGGDQGLARASLATVAQDDSGSAVT